MANQNNKTNSRDETKKINAELEEMGLDPVPDPEEPDYVMSDGKNPYPLLIFENICRLLECDPKYKESFRFNEFSHMTEVKDESGQWNDLQDHVILELRRYISSEYQYFAKVAKEMVIDAVISVSHQTIINPPRDYLLELEWDGVERLGTWLHVAYGAPKNKLYDAIGSNWMKGLVKRVLYPGCQFDEVLVLEGAQGTRKSSSLRALGSPWHVETTYSNDKDFFLILAKNCIVEFSEGDILSRAGVRAVKALITKTEDQYRVPYERSTTTLKRGCVFAMTTNDTDYLKDETGNRRWLPVKLERDADIDWILANRDQLYAEAVHRVETLNETTWEYPKDALEILQDSRTAEESHMEEIEDWYLAQTIKRRQQGIRVKEVWEGAIREEHDKASINKALEYEIARSLRKMGMENKITKQDGKAVRRWFFTRQTKKKYAERWTEEIVNTEIF